MHPSSRFVEIDLLRSLAICMMVLYHTVYDLHHFLHYSIDPLSTGWWLFARMTAILFLLLVGCSFELSAAQGRNKRWKRIGTIVLCALLITGVTYYWDPTTYIRFGILHCIAASLILLTILPQGRIFRMLAAAIILGIGQATPFLHVTNEFFLPLGITPKEFSTLDYFPLFPWFGIVLMGTLIVHLLLPAMHTYAQEHRRTVYLATLPGRHALLLYMLHQPLLIGILSATLA
ncbi:MAG TPA: heparan-alpha-glucosaminide N-acetyltransferase [Candidatus Peribacteraceae bacterium]|nr:heparan-alpha-glucosaminide N-acetyltransferase [Candidatus Peribacteraceae bacterium]